MYDSDLEELLKRTGNEYFFHIIELQTDRVVCGGLPLQHFQSEASHICSLLRHLKILFSFFETKLLLALNRKDMK